MSIGISFQLLGIIFYRLLVILKVNTLRKNNYLKEKETKEIKRVSTLNKENKEKEKRGKKENEVFSLLKGALT